MANEKIGSHPTVLSVGAGYARDSDFADVA